MGRPEDTKGVGWTYSKKSPYLKALYDQTSQRYSAKPNSFARRLFEQRMDLLLVGWKPEDVRLYALIERLVKLPEERVEDLYDLVIGKGHRFGVDV